VAGSNDASAFLLVKGDLTTHERQWLEEWGFTLPDCSRTGGGTENWKRNQV
jgi:hypothetical protein